MPIFLAVGTSMQQKLSGLQIWVTRPAHQANTLKKMIIAQGGQAILFPVIAIEPIALTKKLVNTLNNLSAIDYIVFISPNAVELGVAALLQYGKIPKHLKLVTIGQASARKLQQLSNRSADISPTDQYNSEALLAHQELQPGIIEHKQFLIFRGVGGRELLADTLKKRGANVHYAEVYQRLKPEVDKEIIELLGTTAAQSCAESRIITLTSNEGLNNMVKIFSDANSHQAYQQLLLSPIVVVTEKMRRNAINLGFKNDIIIAAKASNEALIEAIQTWFKKRNKKSLA